MNKNLERKIKISWRPATVQLAIGAIEPSDGGVSLSFTSDSLQIHFSLSLSLWPL